MVNSRSSPTQRTQRALSMAAETRTARDAIHFSDDYPYTQQHQPIPSIPSIPSHHENNNIPQSTEMSAPTYAPSLSSASSTSIPSIKSSTNKNNNVNSNHINPYDNPPSSIFGPHEHFLSTSSSPSLTPEQRKEAKVAQRQRREQIILMLQQQQIEAQEKAQKDKHDRQQAKLERKQKRTELKELQQQNQPDQKDGPFSPQLHDVQYHASQYYHLAHSASLSSNHSSSSSSNQYPHDHTKSLTFTSSGTGPSSSSNRNSQQSRSLSLKSTTKSMYDLRPWSGSGGPPPQSPTYDMYSGYESDEASGSHGWDSLMETLHSPTAMSSPSDTISWDSKEDYDQDMVDSMGALGLSHDNGNGNGKYLLILGANGRTGLELVRQGLERNYRVTAFVRDDKLLLEDSTLRKNHNLLIVCGSPISQTDLDRCVEGQDVVVNVIGARLMTGDSTISSHSQVVLNNAMKKHGVRRLIVVTSYGCLGLRNYLINTRKLFSRMFMTGILKDKVLQEDIVQRDSTSLDWTIVRPITLKDGDLSKKYVVSSCELPKTDKVKVLTRKDLAHYLLTIINRQDEYGAIRSIAGKPKQTKPSPFCTFERKREIQEQARLQKEQPDFEHLQVQEKRVI
ncbi:hypothetical protein BG004_004793 [Podila humilis]|nr:hypothetical protein BG004_004793 [Podila humilis]